jgi:hypothetical protein
MCTDFPPATVLFFITPRKEKDWKKAFLLLCYLPCRGTRLNNKGEDLDMEKLFSVYKKVGDAKILVGGMVERRRSRRMRSNQKALVEIAKRKFKELTDEEIEIVLEEEK